jgi:small subunit ribosomal protein S8
MYINLLIQLKNAQAAKKEGLKVPYSKMDESVLEILLKNKFIKDFEKKGRGAKKILNIELKYDGIKGAINGIKIISKPSRRLYAGYKEIRPVKGGHGTAVLSTPKGIMAGKEAKKNKVGGEMLFEIW